MGVATSRKIGPAKECNHGKGTYEQRRKIDAKPASSDLVCYYSIKLVGLNTIPFNTEGTRTWNEVLHCAYLRGIFLSGRMLHGGNGASRKHVNLTKTG